MWNFKLTGSCVHNRDKVTDRLGLSFVCGFQFNFYFGLILGYIFSELEASYITPAWQCKTNIYDRNFKRTKYRMAAAFALASDVFSEPETSPIASLSHGRTNIYNRSSKHTKHRIAALAFPLASDVFSEPGTSHIASTSQGRTNIYNRNFKHTTPRMAVCFAASSICSVNWT